MECIKLSTENVQAMQDVCDELDYGLASDIIHNTTVTGMDYYFIPNFYGPDEHPTGSWALFPRKVLEQEFEVDLEMAETAFTSLTRKPETVDI